MAEAKAQNTVMHRRPMLSENWAARRFSAGLARPDGPPNPQTGRLRTATKTLHLCPHRLEQDAFLGQVPNAAPGKWAGSSRTGSLSFWQGSVSRDGCEGQGAELRAT